MPRITTILSGLTLVWLPSVAYATPLREHFDAALLAGSPWLFPIVFVAGIISVATPCVLPMVPIVLGTIGVTETTTRRVAIIRSAAYVAGITVMYSALGLIAARTGTMLGSVFTHRATHVAIALLYLALALAAFGVYELRLPSAASVRIGRLGGASALGAFGAGLAAGFLALPCVGPVLAGILTYVGTTQHTVFGTLLLTVHALGFGLPFACIGIGVLRLPKRGPWMRKVEVMIGVALLAGAGWFIRNAVARDGSTASGWCMEGPEGACLTASCADHDLTVVDFGAVWCAACIKLDRTTFRDPTVQDALARHGRVRIDVDRAEAVAERFAPRGLPTVAFLDRTCAEHGDRIEGMIGPTEFLERLRRAESRVQ